MEQTKDVSKMSRAELEAEIARFKAMKAAIPKPVGLKVSAKGAVSLYGLGRFPVTLYASQWAAILSQAAEITAFLVENKASLKVKGE